ncbi:unnamed protein product (macronuclear) [Paramecium tetraurelia]|uniref:Trimethylguanosine synthase n=1 Tax=Paramecium tetraurelia TaxID=5888 RepID=A0E2U1_PARTE|nr:uncharacterized protein GSPATT00022780001 [Paramecium tetraurelia]CAK89608.1 unnamed protein product [Paramecium tetraurelia]|eukprot:XP_001457005.1 hypothetical protein (macronuclear) [Paramecium tetraurelia strain d4-2]
MSSKKKNISKNDDGYDDVGCFCGWIKKKSSKNVNIEQSRISLHKQQRNSLYKSALDVSNHNGTSQLNQLNSTNSETQTKNSDMSPFVSSFAIPIFENNYPSNQLFQLKNNQSGDSIFAKITSTKIDVPKSLGFNQDICNDPKISDQISKYIATRIKDQINSLAEFGCGDGGNTVQFAKYLDFVIAIDKSTEACLKTRKNCDQDTLNKDFPNPKVEIINSDIFKLKRRLPFDSIFINPTINTENAQICKDLLKDCQPNLQQLLMMISDQIENLIIQFPAQIDYSQLPLLLNINQQYQNNTQHKYQSLVSQHKQQQSFIAHCSLEIEKIYVNGIHIQNIIYYGKIANITREELRSILITQLQNQEVKPEAIQNLITKLKDKIGSLEVVYELLNAQSFKYNIDKFLEVVCDKYKLEYGDYAYILYQKLSKEFSQNTFNYHHNLKESTHEVQESEYAYSPKFSYNLNGLQMDDTNSIDENEDMEALGLSQDDKKSKLK